MEHQADPGRRQLPDPPGKSELYSILRHWLQYANRHQRNLLRLIPCVKRCWRCRQRDNILASRVRPLLYRIHHHSSHYYYQYTLHPFNGLFSMTTWVNRHQKGKPIWILLAHEMLGWQWHQLDNMQIICTSLQTDNHASTSPLSFYRPDALPAAQSTVSRHWRQALVALWLTKIHFHPSL